MHEVPGILVGDALGAIEFRGFAMNDPTSSDSPPVAPTPPIVSLPPSPPVEIGGRKGPEPTRYGDWEKDGRCIDF